MNYVVLDNQGSVEASIPAGAGSAEVLRAYTPYGLRRMGGQFATDQGWLGQIEDESTGLQYLSARYYAPDIGMFTSVDPLASQTSSQSYNPYSYARGRPTTLADPAGLWPSQVDPGTKRRVGRIEKEVGKAVGTVSTVVKETTILGKDLPDLPNLPAFPGGPDLPDLPNLPKLPSICFDSFGLGDCTSAEEHFVTEIADEIFEGTDVSEELQNWFVASLLLLQNYDEDGNVYFVADSGVFMDRPGVDRAFFDAILASPMVTLYVKNAIVREVSEGDIYGTQLVRYHGAAANIEWVGEGPEMPASFSPEGNFNWTDGTVVELARQVGAPVLTANRRMANQVRSNANLCPSCGWETVSFITPPS